MLLMPALYLGRSDVWLGAFDDDAPVTSRGQFGRPTSFLIRLAASRALCLAQVGRLEEARTLIRPLLDAATCGGIDDEAPFGPLALLLQAAVALEDKAGAQALSARLACVAHLSGDSIVLVSVARQLGDAAALAGDRTAARGYYLQALDSTSKIGFRPELALTHLRLAELSLKEPGSAAQSEALEHLDIAIPELTDMKMQPGLERALAVRENLRTSRRPVPDSASDTLTAREREIASLMAAGLTNHEIGERLVIAEGTVEVHVKHILSKLGFRSRTQVAMWLGEGQRGSRVGVNE
jgi:ATP/maltotriose-dependent transcriptional regulator MalT